MIVSRLAGGLGNQLFQYAAGRSLSLRLKKPFAVDTNYYLNQSARKYELTNFNIKIPLDVTIPEEDYFTYKEPHFHYDPNFYGLEKPYLYLIGFWQSERYFRDIKSDLVEEFQVKDDLIGHLGDISKQLEVEESVCVHIRRTDYQGVRHVLSHGFIPIEYYYSAIHKLAEMKNSCKFYFFSDDIEWVKKSLRIPYPHQFISGSVTQTNIEDFFLMNKCRHSIIANSSFSWWSAWLNTSESQIVFAPKLWLNGENYNCKDILPNHWIKL